MGLLVASPAQMNRDLVVLTVEHGRRCADLPSDNDRFPAIALRAVEIAPVCVEAPQISESHRLSEAVAGGPVELERPEVGVPRRLVPSSDEESDSEGVERRPFGGAVAEPSRDLDAFLEIPNGLGRLPLEQAVPHLAKIEHQDRIVAERAGDVDRLLQVLDGLRK